VSARPGLFVAVVGPSGAGKDSVMRAAVAAWRREPRPHVVRRVVTREADAHEDHATLSPDAFAAAERNGAFALVWRAHGLAYGVPVEADAEIAAGRTVLCNLSRGAVATARARFPRMLAALVTARPETLAARLAARGRESADERAGRLSRAKAEAPAFVPDVVIDNDGALEDAVARFLAAVEAGEAA